MSTTKIFIHGLESSSGGTKGVYFRAHFPDMIVEDFEGSFENRMKKLNRLLLKKKDVVIVGSSYGGLMAAVYACEHTERVRKMILLAPALNLDEFAPYRAMTITLPVILFHGRFDDVVPPDEVRHIAGNVFSNLEYHLIDDDHPLRETFGELDWERLLSAGD